MEASLSQVNVDDLGDGSHRAAKRHEGNDQQRKRHGNFIWRRFFMIVSCLYGGVFFSHETIMKHHESHETP